MATRQQLFTAIGLIRQTCRINRHGDGLILHLQGLGDYTDNPKEPEKPDGLTPFERQRRACEIPCRIIYEVSGKLNSFLGKVDTQYLDAGIDAIPVPATRLKIIADVENSNTRSANVKPFIEVANELEDLADLNDLFEFFPQCGVTEPDPWKLFAIEVNHANILHDVLDAMSYELQGKNSANGNLHNYDNEQLEKLITNRVFTANIYLSHLPNNVDTQEMRNVVQYVEQNFGKLENAILGQYIDSNIPKQVIVRREWAL